MNNIALGRIVKDRLSPEIITELLDGGIIVKHSILDNKGLILIKVPENIERIKFKLFIYHDFYYNGENNNLMHKFINCYSFKFSAKKTFETMQKWLTVTGFYSDKFMPYLSIK